MPVCSALSIVALLIFSRSSLAAGLELDVVSRPFTNIAKAFGDSAGIELSADGRWAAFTSNGNGLATNDSGLNLDVFLKDLQSGETILVSRNASGASGNGDSVNSGLSADGRYLLLESSADDLALNDLNETTDLFLYDRETRAITVVSAASSGTANAESGAARLSANGRFVLFESNASDLSPLDQNDFPDLYLFDRELGTNKLVTLNAQNTSAASSPFAFPQIGRLQSSVSEDGRYVAFNSTATNLVSAAIPANTENVYLRDMLSQTNLWISRDAGETPLLSVSRPVITRNGSHVAFFAAQPAGTSSQRLYLYSVQSNVLSAVPFPPGTSTSPTVFEEFAFSGNGEFLVYMLNGQVYLHHLRPGGMTRLITAVSTNTPANGPSSGLSISDDGTVVTFTSAATDLAPQPGHGYFQLYSFTRGSNKITPLSLDPSRAQGANRDILMSVVSGDGKKAGFMTYAWNLVANDDKLGNDVFVVSASGTNPVELVSQPLPSSLSATAAGSSELRPRSLSLDGRFVVFTSQASDLAPNDTNESLDIFRHDRLKGTTELVSISPDGIHSLPVGSQLLGMSIDARRIVFTSTNAASPEVFRVVYVYDANSRSNSVASILPNGTVAQASEANISDDGRYVAFRTEGLGAAMYVRDLEARITHTVSHQFSGIISAFIGMSPGGKYLVFFRTSTALRLIDWRSGASFELSGGGGTLEAPMPSDDSSVLIYQRGASAGALSGTSLYLFSLNQNSSNLIATNSFFATISADGSTVAYVETLINSNRLVIHDVASGLQEPLQLSTESFLWLRSNLVLSDDGRYLFFAGAGNLAGKTNGPPFANVYRYDRVLTNLTLLSATPAGDYGNFGSADPSISADGRTFVFQSSSTDLVANDRNFTSDVFAGTVPMTDTDRDGLEDGWEKSRFGNLESGGETDSDGDGISNLQEHLSGTDPRQATSHFATQVVKNGNGELGITWTSARGKAYQLQFRPNLATGDWINVGEARIALANTVEMRIENEEEAGFYRVRLIE